MDREQMTPASPPAPQAGRHAADAVPRRPRARVRGIIGYIALGMASLLVAALAFLWIAPPSELIRDRVVSRFEAVSGRSLRVDGSIGLSFLPPGLSLENVTVSGPQASAGPLVTAERADVTLSLQSVFTGRMRAEKVTLQRPRLRLYVDAAGRRSWERAAGLDVPDSGTRRPRVMTADAGGRTPAAPARQARPPLGTIELRDGSVEIVDERIKTGLEFRAVNGTLVQPQIGEPVAIDLAMSMSGEPLRVTGTAARLATSPEDAVPVKVAMEGANGRALFDGTVAGSDGVALDGALTVAFRDFDAAMRWLGAAAPSQPSAGGLELSARIARSRTSVSIRDLAFRSSAISGDGGLEVVLGGERPRFAGTLRLSRLDLDQLLDGGPRGGPKAVRAKGAGPAAGAPGEASPGENDPATGDREAGPPPAGTEKPTRPRGVRPWQEEPIPFAALGRLDGEARLTIDRMKWRQTEIGAVSSRATLVAGALRLVIDSAAMFGGTAKGVMTADTDQRLRLDVAIAEAAALDMLRAVANFDVLEGPARLRIAVSGKGGSEREIIDSLAGTTTIEITKGLIRGWSASEAIAEARRLRVPEHRRNPAATTPFETLALKLAISEGVAKVTEGAITATPLSLDGTGTIDLPRQRLDLNLNPRVAEAGRTGFTLPLTLAGPWSEPRLRADLRQILRSPSAVIEAAREAARGVKGEDVDKAARRAFGDNPIAKEGAERMKRLLRRFLKDKE